MSTRVLVVDDQTVVRDGLVLLLGLLPDLEVVAAAGDGAEAVRLVGEHRPDVVLMDLRMPRMDGVEATRLIKESHPETQIVVLTTFSDDDSVVSALEAGARGFLTKDAGAEEIARAITAVLDGTAPSTPPCSGRMVGTLAGGQGAPRAARRRNCPTGSPRGRSRCSH